MIFWKCISRFTLPTKSQLDSFGAFQTLGILHLMISLVKLGSM